jgi:hypothetical protein
MFLFTVVILQISFAHFGFFGNGDTDLALDTKQLEISKSDKDVIQKSSDVDFNSSKSTINYFSIFLFGIFSFLIGSALSYESIPSISTIDDMSKIGLLEVDNHFITFENYRLNTIPHLNVRPPLADLGRVCNIFLRCINYDPIYYMFNMDNSPAASRSIHMQTLFNFVLEVRSYKEPSLNRALNYLLVYGQDFACYVDYPVTSEGAFIILKRLCCVSYPHLVDIGLMRPSLMPLYEIPLIKLNHLFYDPSTNSFLKLY